MLRKFAIWLLLIPMPLNGLWITCKDAPSAVPDETQSAPEDETNLIAMFDSGDLDTDTGDSGACKKVCSFSAGQSGTLCLVTGESKTSFSIVVFGVPILPAVFK